MPSNLKFHFQRAGQVRPQYATPNCATGESGVMLGVSDNTLFDIGDYMAVLSTEIALLKHKSQSYEATMQELYFALQALNRLDKEGEKYLDDKLPLSLDGRFIRDQYNEFAHENWKDYDTMKYVNAKSYRTFTNFIEHNGPYLGDCSEKDYEYLNIMSKDEIIGMLWGLAFVKKYVPNEYVDRNGQDGIYIVDEAINIANRIMTYMTTIQNHEKKCGLFNEVTMSENWTILYPLIDHRGYNSEFKQDDLIGNDFFPAIAPPIVALGNYITGNTYSHVKTKIRTRLYPSVICYDYNRSIDHTWQYNGIVRALVMDRNSAFFHLQTILYPAAYILFRAFEAEPGNGWVSASLNVSGSLIGPMSTADAYKIMKKYKIDLKFELAYAQFRNAAPSQPKPYWLELLNDAPECDYIRVDTAWNAFNCEFFGRSMWGKKLDSEGKPNHDFGNVGLRNGLDYMLLYNLFHLQYEKNTEPYFKNACDCEQRFQLYNSPEIVLTGESHVKGETKIRSIPNYQSWGISTESYINKNLVVNQGGELKLLEFVAICTKVQDPQTTVSVNGDLIVGNNNIISTLRVGSDATLQINYGGDVVVNPNSILKISKGGKIEAKPGSKLYLKNGSKLIIEDGGLFEHFGEIIAESNTRIIITDGGVMEYKSPVSITFNNNLKFEIAGKLDVHTIFDLNGQGTIDFYTRNNVQPLVEVQSGAQFKVTGLTSSQHKITAFDFSRAQIHTYGSGLTNFSFGTAFLGESANILFYGNMSVIHFKFNAQSGSARQGNGIIMYPEQSFTLLNTDFENLDQGLDLVLTSSPSTKSILSCDFKDNKNGLKITGKGFTLSNGTFVNNSNIALAVEGINMMSQINNSTFTNANKVGHGIVNKGAYQAVLNINDYTLSGFYEGITCEIGKVDFLINSGQKVKRHIYFGLIY